MTTVLDVAFQADAINNNKAYMFVADFGLSHGSKTDYLLGSAPVLPWFSVHLYDDNTGSSTKFFLILKGSAALTRSSLHQYFPLRQLAHSCE